MITVKPEQLTVDEGRRYAVTEASTIGFPVGIVPLTVLVQNPRGRQFAFHFRRLVKIGSCGAIVYGRGQRELTVFND